ncbi:MAG: hypothetical protein QGF00_35180 [Planctomycetota bacterium]|jgi:hypothetical protein|nr:hypothetical protein [Planctomycetota bacterium]MDP7254894.1 hypothetical protein [Planctomycetota bacterium]
MLPEGPAPFTPGSPGQEGPEPPSTPWWEDAAVILAIASVWPIFLRWQGRHWLYLMYAAAAIMIIIFIRRMRRLNRLTREHKQTNAGPFQFGQGGPDSWQDGNRETEN